MSHDLGASNARPNRTWTAHPSPNAGRPSLFGSTDDDTGDTPDRVRILSTLNAQQPPSKRAKTRSSWTRDRHAKHQPSKVLWIMMMLGVSGAVLGLALTWWHQPDTSAPVSLTQEPVPVAVTAPSPTVVSDAASSAATEIEPDVARIESLPVQMAGTDVPAQAILASFPAATAAAVALNGTPAAPDKPASQATTKSVTKKTVKKVAAKSDADVALIEAMFTHTKPPATQAAKSATKPTQK